MTRPLTLLLLLFSFSISYSQDRSLDSLKTVLTNPRLHDTTRLQMINNFAESHFTNNFDPKFHAVIDMLGTLAVKNYNKSNTPALQKKYATWLASYYSSLATRYLQQEAYDKSERYFDKSIALYKASKSAGQMYAVYLSKSRLYSTTNQTDKAIALIFDALKYYEKDKKANVQSLIYAYTTVAYLYRYQNEFEKAILNSGQAEHFCDLSYKANPNNNTLNWKASNYQNIAYCNSQLKRYREALIYCNKSLEITRKIGATVQTTLALAAAADMQMKLSDFAAAEKLYEEILSLKTATTDNMTLAAAYFGLGNLNFNKDDLANAQLYEDKAFELSKKTSNKTLQKNIAELLYKIHLANKNYEKALVYYDFDKKISDSTQVASAKKEISQQQLKYDFEKKELQQKILQQKKLEALKLEAANEKAAEVSKNKLERQQLEYDFEKSKLNEKIAQGKRLSAVRLDSQMKTAAIKLESEKKQAAQKSLVIGLSGVLLLLISGGIFYYRNSRQKQSIATLEKNQIKQKLLVTQMNPHFIFNSIENIRGLISERQNDQAVTYLGKFSKLTRQILENSNENYISLAEEVEMTANYLVIQQLLYDNKFDFNIAVEDAIDVESTFLPPMLTQPFIENAIKHGLSNITEKGLINIRFYLEGDKLFFEVSDNGQGFDAQKKQSNHKSLAMTITKERLVGYTKNKDFVVQADNIKDHNEKIVGAKVQFEIPYIYEN